MKFLHTSVAIAALAAVLGSATAANAARAYIGTYTVDPADPKSAATNHGEGIYLVNVDDATGAPSSPKLVAKSLSPTWVTLSADHKYLYAVNEIASYGNKSGSITAYAVDKASGALKLLNVVDSGGSIPCFVSIHPSGKFLLVANYTGGSYSVTRLKPDGSLGETTDVVRPGGPMSVYNAVDKPPGMFPTMEPHGSRGHILDPSVKFLYSLNQVASNVTTFRIGADGVPKFTGKFLALGTPSAPMR